MAEAPASSTPGPATLLFRHVLQERMRARFRPGIRVLNLGCGAGEDALWLASIGTSVLGLDPSLGRVQQARRAAAAAGTGSRVRFEVRRAHELRLEDGTFDAAFVAPGALDGTELGALRQPLAAVLRAGAPVLVSVPAPRPAVARLGARQRAQETLGLEFTWRRGFGLGIVLARDTSEAWAAARPQAFAVLAMLERAARDAAFLRDLGDHLVLAGMRR
jgi:SAM-dependent methyltransferase